MTDASKKSFEDKKNIESKLQKISDDMNDLKAKLIRVFKLIKVTVLLEIL